MQMPKKRFTDHGSLWIFAVVRFPPISIRSAHRWEADATRTSSYKHFAADPTIMAAEPPEQWTKRDIFGNDTSDPTAVYNTHPFGQELRFHPERIHRRYAELQGYPFVDAGNGGINFTTFQVNSAAYDGMFQESQLEHWNCQLKARNFAMRNIPDPRASIFSGT